MLQPTAFLRQAHRNNWQKYLASLSATAERGWDVCVLTASDETQANMYRRQLAVRRESGLLPNGTVFMVIPDPGGKRIGSGGATLRVLAALRDAYDPDCFRQKRILVIHSGGDSKRLPHCSATGKLFARLPRALPDGRATTLFDEFLISLSGLATELRPGLLVASGDVLLIFDHLQLQFPRDGVIGVAAAAPAAMGEHHGVYVTGDSRHSGGRQIEAYLHKPPLAELRRWHAMDEDSQVQIDTGLVWLDAEAAQAFLDLTQEAAVESAMLNLYGDLLLPLAQSTAYEAYLADASDGPATAAIQAARQVIWPRLRGIRFTVERLQPTQFVHFGTTSEYYQLNVDAPDLATLCDWDDSAASWLAPDACATGTEVIAINACIERPIQGADKPALVIDSHLKSDISLQGAALLANLQTAQPLEIQPDLVLHQLPVTGGYVTRVYGLLDNPKHVCGSPEATYCNRPWATWLEEAGIGPEELWPDQSPADRTLWNAQLFPVLPSREQSLALSLPLQSPSNASRDWLEAWKQAKRISLAESFSRADAERIIVEQTHLEDTVAIRRFIAAVEREAPAGAAAALLSSHSRTLKRRSQVAGQDAHLSQLDPLLRLRCYKALGVAAGDSAWEDKAFALLAHLIEDATPEANAPTRLTPSETGKSSVTVSAAARIDFGGGWTDTPPYSIERGGTVLNAALSLNGELPIVTEARWLADQKIVLECADIDAKMEPTRVADLLDHRNPGDPFALLKAAIVMRGLVTSEMDPDTPLGDLARKWGGGLHLHTRTNIPRGSGLGTSSILAGAVLLCLGHLLDAVPEETQLFDEVLCLEQMMTTGGGWQDQIGGLVGGIKLLRSEPGLPQHIRTQAVQLSPAVREELDQRLLLLYTGQQRLAKNLLQMVMGRWMARDPEMIWIQERIGQLASEMHDALVAGDIDSLGELIAAHWELNKRMDLNCSNPFIDDLFATCKPYLAGYKLAGAGGGGFAILIAKDRRSGSQLGEVLQQAYAGTGTGLWPSAIADPAVRVH